MVETGYACSRSEKLRLLGKSARLATTESDNHTMTHSHSRPGLAERDVPALSTCNSSHFRYVSVRLLCIQAHQDCAAASSKPTRSGKTRSVLRVARAYGSQGTRNSRFSHWRNSNTAIPVCMCVCVRKRETLSSRNVKNLEEKEYTSFDMKSIISENVEL